MPKKAESNEPKSLDFEQALEQLEVIVADLEAGSTGLAESLTKYERGVTLLKQCYRQLERAERRIEQLSGVDAEGNPITEPFDHDDDASLDEKAASRSKRRTKKKPSGKSSSKPSKANQIDETQGLF